jgi:hypothetical protein
MMEPSNGTPPEKPSGQEESTGKKGGEAQSGSRILRLPRQESARPKPAAGARDAGSPRDKEDGDDPGPAAA